MHKVCVNFFQLDGLHNMYLFFWVDFTWNALAVLK